MIPKSVRWRLPLSYAAIALLAALALGLVLLTTLRGYYRQQELDYLNDNAQVMGASIARLFELDAPPDLLQSQLRSFAFLSQTRVQLLDADARMLADSGSPQEQQATLVLEGTMLDIQNAEDIPAAPADVAGLFVRREGDSLFVGTGISSGVKTDDGWEIHYDGPVVEVLVTGDTLVYRDDTLQQLGGVPPSGPIEQVIEPASLDELGKNSTLEAWGTKRDELLAVEVLVFAKPQDDGMMFSGDFEVITRTVPLITSEQAKEEGSQASVVFVDKDSPYDVTIETSVTPNFSIRVVAPLSGENQYVPIFSAYSVGTPYGFGLNAETPAKDRRSEQATRQPFYDLQGQLLGYVELSEGPAYGRQVLDSVTRGWVIASSVAVALAALAGWIASRRLTTPLLALADVTALMAKGDLSARADVNREDELGLLANSFNDMAGQVQETIAALRRFVADAAHELHTPLTALRTNLELVADEQDRAQQRDFVGRAQAQVERLENLTRSLLNLSQLESGAAQKSAAPVELTALLREVSEPYASRAEQAGLVFVLDLPDEPLTVLGNRGQLRQALGNLLDNALKFSPQGGEVEAGLHQEGDWVSLWVQDSGIGIPAEDLPRLFNRFHRGRNAAAYPGSGLGLAIVKAIVTGHGGQVMAQNREQGARFVLKLPIHVVNIAHAVDLTNF